jgi:hypothetical protein
LPFPCRHALSSDYFYTLFLLAHMFFVTELILYGYADGSNAASEDMA